MSLVARFTPILQQRGTVVAKSRHFSSSSAPPSPQFSRAVRRRVETMVKRHAEVVELLNQGTNSNNSDSLGKEMSSLAQVASLHERFQQVQYEQTSLQELLDEAIQLHDVDMQQECQDELATLEQDSLRIQQELLFAVLPRNEDDYHANAILEIRAGTGGDEAALFTNELLTAYQHSTSHKGWKWQVLSQTKTDLGGIKEAAVSITSSSSGGSNKYGYASTTDSDNDNDNIHVLQGLGPFGYFKFESGVHRVQRVPINDSKIQTSACSVAVLPLQSDDSNTRDSLLPLSELKIETMRASGAGGQHVNTTESAVRITHIPTGITASIQDERSQHKNKAKALKLIAARVHDALQQQESQQRGDERNSLMGSGDRSERIRTYNYPQDRITDHRCKYTENGISKLFGNGQLVDCFAPPMRLLYREQLMKQLQEEDDNNDENIEEATK